MDKSLTDLITFHSSNKVDFDAVFLRDEDRHRHKLPAAAGS